MSSIRHAGDAIAHDLRSPLTRMRAKLEVALIDAESGRIDGVDALGIALDRVTQSGHGAGRTGGGQPR